MSSITEEFNERLEAFVQKYGLKNASGLLEVLTRQKMPKNMAARNRLMSDFLQLEVLKTFEITLEEYRENRIKSAIYCCCPIELLVMPMTNVLN